MRLRTAWNVAVRRHVSYGSEGSYERHRSPHLLPLVLRKTAAYGSKPSQGISSLVLRSHPAYQVLADDPLAPEIYETSPDVFGLLLSRYMVPDDVARFATAVTSTFSGKGSRESREFIDIVPALNAASSDSASHGTTTETVITTLQDALRHAVASEVEGYVQAQGDVGETLSAIGPQSKEIDSVVRWLLTVSSHTRSGQEELPEALLAATLLAAPDSTVRNTRSVLQWFHRESAGTSAYLIPAALKWREFGGAYPAPHFEDAFDLVIDGSDFAQSEAFQLWDRTRPSVVGRAIYQIGLGDVLESIGPGIGPREALKYADALEVAVSEALEQRGVVSRHDLQYMRMSRPSGSRVRRRYVELDVLSSVVDEALQQSGASRSLAPSSADRLRAFISHLYRDRWARGDLWSFEEEWYDTFRFDR